MDGIHLATIQYTTTNHSTKGSQKCFWQCQTNISKADVRAKTITEASFHQSSASFRAYTANIIVVMVFQRELALLVALQGESIWKKGGGGEDS